MAAGQVSTRPEANSEGPALPRGTTVGRYVVLDQVGAGSMGAVFAAFDQELDRRVALKLMHERGTASESKRSHERLLREAQAMAKLSHPNTVTVLDVGEHTLDGVAFVYLAMEFVRGETLSEWSRTPRPWREVVRVFVEAGRGLAAAHAQALVHCDFKPDNVMLGDDGRVRLMDFGIAEEGGDSDEDGAAAGTPAYMSPEHHLGLARTPQSDQFSYCVALYELLYGRRPFKGNNPAAIGFSVVQGDHVSPPSTSEVPSRVWRVIERGLQRAAPERFPAMDALLDALEDTVSPRSRRRVAAAGALLAVGLTFGGGTLWSKVRAVEAEASCNRASEELRDGWGPVTRQAVLDADPSPEATEHAVPWIDRAVDGWTDARATTCAPTFDDATPPSRTDVLACLDAQRIVIEATIRVLVERRDQVYQPAVTAAAQLPLANACLRPNNARHIATALAEDPALAAAVAEIGARLELAQYDRARSQVDALLGQESAARSKSNHATLLRLSGIVAWRQGRLDDAIGTLEEAYHLAGAAGDSDNAFSAARRLAYVAGVVQKKPDAGLAWTRHANMWLDRMELPEDHLHRGGLLGDEGQIAQTAGDFETAQHKLKLALEILRTRLGETHPQIAIARSNLGNVFQALRDFPAAQEHYEAALAIYEAAFGETHPHVAQALGNLGTVHGSQRHLDAAQAVFERALTIQEATLGDAHPDLAITLNNLGVIYKKKTHFTEAAAFHRRALAIRREALGSEHPAVSQSLLNLAALQKELADYGEASESATQALAIREAALGAEHPELAAPLDLLASIRAKQDRLDESVALYDRALPLWAKRLGDEHPHVVE
ncbi:MAG: serine/threonine-protein kinase, partial [Myxococcota bacterium]